RRLEVLGVDARCIVSHSARTFDYRMPWLHLRILPATSSTHAAIHADAATQRSCAPPPMRQGTGARTSLYTVLRILSKNGAAAYGLGCEWPPSHLQTRGFGA